MKLSLAITTHNRIDMTLKSFSKVIDDNRINEIVIVDDCSDSETQQKLFSEARKFSKVRLVYNDKNLGMSRNKAKAISLCSNDWVIILDSDNQIDSTYLDAIEAIGELNENVIYCPEFARPNFDYRKYSGQYFDGTNAKKYVWQKDFDCLLNTSNYLVHRESYGDIYQYDEKIKESDTIWFNYLWMFTGGSLYVVPGMQYDHLVHAGSGWLSNAAYNTKIANRIKELIKEL